MSLCFPSPLVAVVVAAICSGSAVTSAADDAQATTSASDPELATGILLRSLEESRWGLRLRLPFSIGFTEFDLDSISLDDVATISLVPSAEFLLPLDDQWTLMPFMGAGGAVALGDRESVSGESALALVTGGARVQRWQSFADRYVVVVPVELSYDAALTSRNGLLGDWGSLTAAVELRRAFGSASAGPRFQLGVYGQGFWFWDPVELEIPGVTPSFLDNQGELGISLGSSTPFRIWGIALPRVFIGVRVGEGVRSFRIRFGRL